MSSCDVDDNARSCGEFVLIGSGSSSLDGTTDMLPECCVLLSWHSLSAISLLTSFDEEVDADIASPVFETGQQPDDVSVCIASPGMCWDCDTTGVCSDEWISVDIPVLCTGDCVLVVALASSVVCDSDDEDTSEL